MKKAKNNAADKRKECSSCCGSHTGVCKNANTTIKDPPCPFYVGIFDKDIENNGEV